MIGPLPYNTGSPSFFRSFDSLQMFPEIFFNFLELSGHVRDEGKDRPPRQVIVQGVEESDESFNYKF